MSSDPTKESPEEAPNKINNIFIEFYGPTNILNDGVTENTLTIGVKNSNVSFFDKNGKTVDPDPSFTFTPNTKISIWFAVSKNQGQGAPNSLQELPWAVTTDDRKGLITLKVDPIEQWDIDHSPIWENGLYSDLSGWEISPKTDFTLKSGEHISLVLSGLKTSLPDGPCLAYGMVYEGQKDPSNLKQLSTLQKTPIHFSQGSDSSVAGKVGIGKAGAEVTLDVQGGIRARGGEPGKTGIKNNGYFFNNPGDKEGGDGDDDSGMSSSKNGQLELYVNSRKAIQINEVTGGTGNIIQVFSNDLDGKEETIDLLEKQQSGTLLGLHGKKAIELGLGETKQKDNGKIGYQTFSDGLDIVGAGSTDANRKLSLHADDVTFQGKNIVNLNSTESINLNATGGITLKTANDANINLNLGEGKLLVNGVPPIVFKVLTLPYPETVIISDDTYFSARKEFPSFTLKDYPEGIVGNWILTPAPGDNSYRETIRPYLVRSESGDSWSFNIKCKTARNPKNTVTATLVFFHKSLCK